MKIAHLILAYNYPVMLERLVRRLQHEEADIYIQLDKKAPIENFAHLENINNVCFVKNRIKTEWGDYSIIEATIAGFNSILESGIAYSHINLLSEQDYPLRPINQFHEFLSANTDKTFMHSLSIADDEWEDGKVRLLKYSLGDYNIPGKYTLQVIANRFLPNRKIPGNLKPYGRSQWITITPECARYAIDYIKTKPKLKRFFRMTWAVDEVFFQIILVNSALNDKLVNDNLRHIEQYGANRPKIFTINDAGTLITSGKFFARKFDDNVDTAIYDRLDAEIGYA